MTLFYMSLMLIEYRALPDATLGQKTGCSLMLLWVLTTLLLVQNTACTGRKSEVRELCVCLHSAETWLLAPKLLKCL